MSELGLTQTVLATQLIEAVRKDILGGNHPINLSADNGKGKIENGHTADWIRRVAKEITSKSNAES